MWWIKYDGKLRSLAVGSETVRAQKWQESIKFNPRYLTVKNPFASPSTDTAWYWVGGNWVGDNGGVILDDNIYRITIADDKEQVSVVCLGIDRLDTPLDDTYPSVDVLPLWVQERLAVLMLLSAVPPTDDVENIGRRISVNRYWVYR